MTKEIFKEDVLPKLGEAVKAMLNYGVDQLVEALQTDKEESGGHENETESPNVEEQ